MNVGATKNILSLCSGVGWLDEGVRLGCEYFGWRPRVLGYAERDSFAAAVLLARMEDASVEPAPVWCGDIADLDAKPMRGMVDILCAGLPCQPYSAAGKQQGNSDRRSWGEGDGPIPHALRIVAECAPALVFFENVPPWVSGGWFRPVGEELCRLGYSLESPLFVTAESVGASHKRERVFIMAHCQGERWRDVLRRAEQGQSRSDQRLNGDGQTLAITSGGRLGELRGSPGRNGQPDGSDPTLADASGQRRQQDAGGPSSDEAANGRARRNGGKPDSDNEPASADAAMDHANFRRAIQSRQSGVGQPEQQSRRASEPCGRCAELADSQQPGPQGIGPGEPQRGSEPVALCRDWGAFAPGPSDPRWPAILDACPHLAPAIEPGFRLLADECSLVVDESRADQLRCGGNGVVAMQAATAFVELMRRALT